MNRFDFTPYRRSTVGFDRLFDLPSRFEQQQKVWRDKEGPRDSRMGKRAQIKVDASK